MAEYIDLDEKIVVFDTRGRERETTVRHILEMNKGSYTAIDVPSVKWIPVTERLPSRGTNVLVFEFGRVEQAHTTTYTADGSLCWVVTNGGNYHRVSDANCPIKWWMPLPEPPKEE